MAITRHDPLRMGQLQNEINRVFSNWGDPDSSAATANWVPTVDIQEYGGHFQLFVDLPGVDPQNVDVTLDNGVLTITGERVAPEFSNDSDSMTRHRAERAYGQFYRRFILPDTVDAENVKAEGRFGVLEITIPKQAKAQPRRIKVAA